MKNIEIVYYKGDQAARNIARMLDYEGFDRFGVRAVEQNILFAETMFEKGKKYIVLSKHKSEKEIKAITCHYTGNWTGDASYGGKPFSTSISTPNIMKGIFLQIKKHINNLEKFSATLEVTHHGPTPHASIMFLEIGSCEADWTNEKAAKMVCKVLQEFEPSEQGEVIMGVGGPHYAPNFTRMIEKYRIGHIIPKYAIEEVNYEVFQKGIENCTQKTEKVVIDWKGVKSEHRNKIVKLCERYGIDYEKYK